MTTWTPEGLEKMFLEYLGIEDPEDPRARKKLRIVEAATELFIAQGYRKTSVDEVAARANVSKGTVYLYFKNKADLMVGAIVMEKKRYIARMIPLFDESMPPRERLREWVKLVLTLAPEMPLISRLISGDREMLMVIQEMPPEHLEKTQFHSHEFLGRIVEGTMAPHNLTRSEVEDRFKVLMSLSYFSGLVADERVRWGLSLDRYAELLADMIVDGLVGRPAVESNPSRDGGGES